MIKTLLVKRQSSRKLLSMRVNKDPKHLLMNLLNKKRKKILTSTTKSLTSLKHKPVKYPASSVIFSPCANFSMNPLKKNPRSSTSSRRLGNGLRLLLLNGIT